MIVFQENIEHKNCCEFVPNRNKQQQIIYLTKSKSAWITISWLSDELYEYTKNHYQLLFDLHPIERGKVVLHDIEVPSQRWHRSYLNTPMRNASHEKRSYMYSGKDAYNNSSLPDELLQYLCFINKNECDDEYNQVILNWYLNGNDFIAAHSDCEMNMKPNAGIAIVTLCEKEEDFRMLQFTPKKIDLSENDFIYSQLKIAALHGCIITMHGDTQRKFKHKVPKSLDIKTSRISLTFRKF